MKMLVQNFDQNSISRRYAPISQIATMFGLSASTLKIKLSCANKKGIPLPTRRRISKTYFYDVSEFEKWLWQNADALRRHYENGNNGDDSDE